MTKQIIHRSAVWFALVAMSVACITSITSDDQVESPTASLKNDLTSLATPATEPLLAESLPDLGPAPDFITDVWLNTDQPLNLTKLQGKVVLVEFWTFG